MNQKKLIVGLPILVLLVAGLAYSAYWFGVQRGAQAPPGMKAEPVSPSSAAEKIDPSTGRRVLYWHDPMVPGQKFDKPGKSPFMDMQLVPVHADEGADTGAVAISPALTQSLGIRTAEVVKGALGRSVEAVGSVVYDERDLVVIQARASGFIEKVHVRATLDAVRKGQPLVDMLSPEWVAAQEEYLALSRMQVADRESLQSAARQRMLLVGMSEEAIRLVESTGKTQARMTYSAPVAGLVAEVGVREGMTVMQGTTLFRINGVDRVWVNAEVPEAQASGLRPGQPVQARAPALPNEVFKGRISALLPKIDSTTRTLVARVELPNRGGRLTPGMFMTVELAGAAMKEALLVPSEAVIQTGRRSVVIVALDGGKFQPQEVKVGAEANGQTEILEGIQAGQKVVSSGQFLIDSEASLKGIVTRMSGYSAPGDAQTSGATHHGQGKVESIIKDEITLSHGPIPTLQWGAMTMGFKTSAAGLPKGIAVGDTVSFSIRQTKDDLYEIVSIERANGKGSAGVGPGAPRDEKQARP